MKPVGNAWIRLCKDTANQTLAFVCHDKHPDLKNSALVWLLNVPVKSCMVMSGQSVNLATQSTQQISSPRPFLFASN